MSVIRLVDKGFDSYYNNNKIKEDLSKAIKYFYASIEENNALRKSVKKYCITDEQVFSLALLTSTFYKEIQSPLSQRTTPNNFISEIISHLDLLLDNKGLITEHQLVYRSDLYIDQSILLKGHKISFNHFLTASKEERNPPDSEGEIKAKFVIETLPNGQSRCRDLYKVLNYGCPHKEFQVNFKCNTDFLITDVCNNQQYMVVKCKELIYNGNE